MLGSVQGLLRLEMREDGQALMQATLRTLSLPTDWVQAVDASAASALAGIPLCAPAWHYPSGGWIAPPRWVRLALAQPGITVSTGLLVADIARQDGSWVARDTQGQTLAQAPILVVACAASAARLLAPWLAAPWPLSATQGQVTNWAGRPSADRLTQLLPRLPVAGDGYAIPLPGGGLLCGATRHDAAIDEMQAEGDVTAADHQLNLERLLRLTGLAPEAEQHLSGRSGWRLHTDDRLPIAGALPLRELPAGQRRDQARLLPREPGLFVLAALGARGLTLAPLLGALIAAQATGTPWPLEQDLVDAVDPARWGVRAARRASSGPDEGPVQRDQTDV
jgi:tRNA 5-methylaminomethyl-2-thiouridine biosynthesis bifunctional protein